MRRLVSMVVFTAIVVGLGCSSKKPVSQEHDETYDFTQLTTYAIRPGEFTTDDVSLVRRRGVVMQMLANAVRRDLTTYKRFTEAPDSTADFIVVTSAGSRLKIDTDVFKQHHQTSQRSDTHVEAKAFIEMLNPGTDEVIWSSEITDLLTGEKTQDDVNSLVSKALKDFPPR